MDRTVHSHNGYQRHWDQQQQKYRTVRVAVPLRLPPRGTGRAVFLRLIEFPWVATTGELIEATWEPDDEPERPEACIHHAIHTLNAGFFPRFYPYLRIISRSRRWRLVIRRLNGVNA